MHQVIPVTRIIIKHNSNANKLNSVIFQEVPQLLHCTNNYGSMESFSYK